MKRSEPSLPSTHDLRLRAARSVSEEAAHGRPSLRTRFVPPVAASPLEGCHGVVSAVASAAQEAGARDNNRQARRLTAQAERAQLIQ